MAWTVQPVWKHEDGTEERWEPMTFDTKEAAEAHVALYLAMTGDAMNELGTLTDILGIETPLSFEYTEVA